MKLKRYDEARRCIEATARTGRFKIKVLNDRHVLEAELGRRKAAFETGQAMTKAVPQSAVLWSNFGQSAFGAFRLEESERAFLASARLADLGKLDFYGSPYRSLSRVYMQQGRMKDSWEALKKGKRQRDLRKPHTLELDQGRMDQASTLFLLALGRAEEALRFARRAHDRPDRTGHTSADETRDAIGNKLLLWTAIQSRLAQLSEMETSSGLLPNVDRKALEFEAWTLQRQLLKLLSGLGEHNQFRPYLTGNASLEPWTMGSLVQVLPAGVATVAIRQAREEDREYPEAAAYYDAFEAEAALARGLNGEAFDLAQNALKKLPVPGEKLLRARTAAVAAVAARQLGNTESSIKLLNQVLADFPQALRLVHASLPVRVQHDGSPLARLLAERLLRSPRFHPDAQGFPVMIANQSGHLVFEMSRLGQERHFQDRVPVKGEEEEVVAAAVKAFYQKMMSPTLHLSEADINLLDGPATGANAQQAIGKQLKPYQPVGPVQGKKKTK
jgi:tetratricopeptide (TPR) repeat protein